VPFQKGPCGEGGREMRGFLLPLLEEASVVVLVLLLIFRIFGHEFGGSEESSAQLSSGEEQITKAPKRTTPCTYYS